MIVAVVVVVVIVVAFLGLYFAGAIPGLKPSSGSSSTGVTFSAARTSATSAATAYNSSYPNLTAAVGLGLTQSISGTVSQVSMVSGSCTPHLASGASGTITVPVAAGGAASGSLPFWDFIFSGSPGIMVVTVINGGASVIATIPSAAGCSVGLGATTSIPSTVIDSSAAASAAGTSSADGTTFLKNNPNANAIFVLIGPVGSSGIGIGATWAVVYSACSVSGSGTAGSAPQFDAVIDATSGTVLTSTSATSQCGSLIPTPGGGGGGTPLGTAIAFHSPILGQAGGSYWTNFTVASASGSLTWHNMVLDIVNSSGTIVVPQSGWIANVVTPGGTVLATYDLHTFTWTSGGSTSVGTGQGLSLVTTSSLAGAGNSIKLYSVVSTYTGSVSVLIP